VKVECSKMSALIELLYKLEVF